jgi:hypothetical protein
MPIYFEMRSPSMPVERASADALAEILQDAVHELNVRVVSIRAGEPNAFVYACAARRKPSRGSVVRRLRSDKRLARFAFSSEAETSDGPFGWEK